MKSIEEIQKLEGMINYKLKDCNIETKIIESKDKYDGKIIILKDKKVIRVFAINMILGHQINVYENDKSIELGLFIDNLGAWIFNLYNKVEFIYVFYGGELNKKVLTKEDIKKIQNEIPLGINEEKIIMYGKEIEVQPNIEGYLGPILEEIDYGKVYLRYETQTIHKMLSA